MRKILYLFFLLLSCDILLSQEQEQNNYFPLAVGNKWEYIKTFNDDDRLVMTITRDTVINGKKYYIFEYNLSHKLFSFTRYFFTPLDPVRVGEKGDIYGYDDLTQNEYLYLRFSERGCYRTYLDNKYVCFEPYRYGPLNNAWQDHSAWWFSNGPKFVYLSSIGMVSEGLTGLDDCWGTIWNPCPPFWHRYFILVYAIIDGEKVYSIEDDEEYLWYMRTNDINAPETYPQQLQLYQNYPNPFNPETRIDFEIPKTDKVKLVIYNTLGKEVKTLLDDELQAGKYSTTWNGKDNMNNKVSSGIYFYQLTFGNNAQSITKKLILIK